MQQRSDDVRKRYLRATGDWSHKLKSMRTQIAIIMPVKNAAPWLEECLDSVLAQNFKDWELIAVDDHSNDSSTDILKAYSEKDTRVTWMSNAGNGIIDALQCALDHSTAPFITRMDADDIMPGDKLDTLWNLLEQREDTVVTGKVEYFSDREISEGYRSYEHWLNDRCEQQDHWKWAYRECVIASANWLTHRDNVVIQPDTYPEDYRLVLHWYQQGLGVKASNRITHRWREHPERTSRTSKHYAQEAFFKLKLEHFLRTARDLNRPLAIMGKNKKAKLCKQILSKNGADYTLIDMENLHQLSELDGPQVLVAVYPQDVILRDGIIQLMESFGLEAGVDWWWV